MCWCKGPQSIVSSERLLVESAQNLTPEKSQGECKACHVTVAYPCGNHSAVLNMAFESERLCSAPPPRLAWPKRLGPFQAPVPPAKPHKPRQERVDEMLESLRTRSTVDEESLINVLKDHRHLRKRFPDAQHLLSQVWQHAVFQRLCLFWFLWWLLLWLFCCFCSTFWDFSFSFSFYVQTHKRSKECYLFICPNK